MKMLIAILTVSMLVGSAPLVVRASAMDSSMPALTDCKDQDAALQTSLVRKAAMHQSLHERHVELVETFAEAIETAQEKDVDASLIERAQEVLAQMEVLKETIETTYAAMAAAREQLIGQACYMSDLEWTYLVGYTTPESVAFEAAGKAAGEYLQETVRPTLQELNEAILTTHSH